LQLDDLTVPDAIVAVCSIAPTISTFTVVIVYSGRPSDKAS
jgi:hypothetical protein